MKPFLNTLLRFAIITSLSDRDVFIEKVSSLLEKYNLDQEKAQKLAMIVATYLEDMKNNINMRNSMRKIFNENNLLREKEMEELTAFLVEITEELQQLKAKKYNV